MIKIYPCLRTCVTYVSGLYTSPRKVPKEGEPQSTTSSRFPALLDRPGGCELDDPLRVHVLQTVLPTTPDLSALLGGG